MIYYSNTIDCSRSTYRNVHFSTIIVTHNNPLIQKMGFIRICYDAVNDDFYQIIFIIFIFSRTVDGCLLHN